MMNQILAAVTLFLLIPAVGADGEDVLCESPQYLERGKRGIVKCQFPEVYYAIFWYNDTDYSEPIMYMKTSNEIGGKGYDSNEYNILSNGSLVINKVSLQDDRNFTAVVLDSPRDEYSPNNIQVIVTVKPFQMQPHIDGCNTDQQLCFKKMNGSSELSCSVTDARPSVDINWYTKTISTDNPLISAKDMTFENSLYTTLAKTTYIPNINENVVYVCKSVSQPLLLTNEYSLVLVQNVSKKFEKIEPTTVYAEHSTSIELPCTDQPTLYLLWRKTGPNNMHTEDLISIVSTDNSSFSKVHSFSYSLTSQRRSLRISEVDVTDEGLYICTFGDGIFEDIKKFSLQVYVIPDPNDPIVEGCNNEGYCALTVPRTGKLKCSLKGIRPKVKLWWETVKDNQKFLVNFSTISHNAEENGLNYDIILMSNFSIQDSSSEWISIRCRAFDYGDIPFDLSREFYLIPLKGPSRDVEREGTVDENNRWKMAFLSFLVFPVGIAAVVAFFVMQKKYPPEKTDEEMAMIEQPDKGKIHIFKEELKTKYSNTWERVCPLPFDKTVSYVINEIFIEGEIEHLENVVDADFGKFYIWQKLPTHNDFLNALRKRQVQIVLEGEPGFGKTTLGYQFAFDWANQNSQSPLKDVDIYILLRLRYLKDVTSIPGAIRRFLLPGDSSLTVQDVKNILYHSNSIVIFLDGYNRFSNDEDNKLTFMKDFRTNNICQKCQVIVTTKPFCLPDELAEDMNRMRLTGFGEASWRKYLKKSVVGNDAIEEERIMKILHDNPLLRDICQVPLFFVLFAHITKKCGYFHGDFNTVTTFFQSLIECFHSHIRTEVNDHLAISSVCFDGLLNKEKGLIWKKEYICNKLGQTLYREYLHVGLIVEKEFCMYRGRSNTRNSGNVKYGIKVRFFHDVFCEWYAAKKLAQVFKTASKEDCKRYFLKINPFDHQYVYRFACAFDEEAAKKIVKYIQSMKDGEKFAILCILEQSGNFNQVEDTIKNICSSPVVITTYDNLFLQRSTVQLLEFACDKMINIECVWLGETTSTFDDDKESLELSSGIFLPKLTTLRQLIVHDQCRELSKKDLIGFLKYISLCDSLKDLRFQACLLPFVSREDLDNISQLIDKKPIDVQWELPVLERNWFKLHIQSGEWGHDGQTMSKQKHDEVVQSFGKSFKTGGRTGDLSDDPGAGTSASA